MVPLRVKDVLINLLMTGQILVKLEELVSSPVLEVQERASSALQVVRLLAAPEGAADRQELGLLYAGELNPVGPKAQKKVPIPDGLGK